MHFRRAQRSRAQPARRNNHVPALFGVKCGGMWRCFEQDSVPMHSV